MPLTRTRTEELAQRREHAVARGVSSAYPLFVTRAEGARLWDADGREYVDFAGGIGTMNVGHGDPTVLAAMHAQIDAFTHTCFQVGMYEGYVALAERLCALAPGAMPKKALFLSTGAEAVENAIKIARNATGRGAVVTFAYGYHGRTLLALSMTNKVAPYKQKFGPYAGEIYSAPFPDERKGWDTAKALAALDEVFATRVSAHDVAAIVMEPVLGEGGFVPAPAAFWRGLRERCDRHGIVLVADEIQTGFGRTGTFFAIEQAGIVPDLITFAKSVAGGLPLSGVVGSACIVDAVDPGGLGGTFAGNPVACAAALATLDVFERDDVLGRAVRLGVAIRARLDALAARYPRDVRDVRGLGPMLAIEFFPSTEPGAPSVAARVAAAAFEESLVVLTAGPGATALRFLVPLVATDDELARGFAALDRACERVLARRHTVPSSEAQNS